MSIFDAYDELAQWVVRSTYDLAEKQHNNPVDVAHLFFVLMNQANNRIAEVLKQGWGDLTSIKEMTKKSLIWMLSIQDNFSISPELNDIFVQANDITKTMWDKTVSIYHIFLSLLKSNNAISKKLNEQWITFEKMQSLIAQMPKSKVQSDKDNTMPDTIDAATEKLDKYAEDLTDLARQGKLKEVIGREKDLAKLIQILCRQEKNNALILGESWVGKTALAELLAQKIVAWEVPESLKDKQILRINLWSLISWTKFRGEFEEKISHIIKTVKASQGKIILFIDEFHNIAWAGKTEWSMGLSEMLLPELSSGNMQVIGATTTSKYLQIIEKDAGLARRLENITLEEPNIQDSITILRWREENFEKHHGVIIYDTALVAAVELSDRYITDRKLPDKAINILDQAATKVKIMMTSIPSEVTDIKIKISRITKEKDSLAQEIATTTDPFIKQESTKKREMIVEEITKLTAEYTSKKSDWEQMKKLFEENKSLEKEVQNKEAQVDAPKSDANPKEATETATSELVDLQNKITTNKTQIVALQSKSWLRIKDIVEREDIAQAVSEKTWIPLTKMIDNEAQKLANLEEYLATKVIGQDEAIAAISNAIRRARIGLKDPKKPIWSFIFLWPTGVGKTELAKALAAFLFFDKRAMVRIDMSEYMEKQSVSRLVGADPWLIGYEEWGQLTEAIRRKPYAVVLLDEIEKAHPDVFNILLQVLDDGRLTDGQWKTIDFKNTIIIMTSNLWSSLIMEKLQGTSEVIWDLYQIEDNEAKKDEPKANQETKHKRNRRPKKKNQEIADKKSDAQDIQREELKEELQPVLREFFRPEFLNRVDENIVFNPITPEMLKNIFEIKIKEQMELVYATNKITLSFTDSAKNYLAKKWRDPANGARPIDRALQRYLINPLAKEIVGGKYKPGAVIKIDMGNDKIVFKDA